MLVMAGAVSIVCLVLLWPGVVEYANEFHITMHWSRFVTAVFGLMLAAQSLVRRRFAVDAVVESEAVVTVSADDKADWKLAVATLGLGLYLVLFFSTRLPSMEDQTGRVMRRSEFFCTSFCRPDRGTVFVLRRSSRWRRGFPYCDCRSHCRLATAADGWRWCFAGGANAHRLEASCLPPVGLNRFTTRSWPVSWGC